MPQSRIRKKKKKNTGKKEKIKPDQVVKQNMFETGNPFQADVPFEKRLEVFMHIADESEKGYEEDYLSVRQYLRDYDPLYLLSFSIVYFLSSQEGIDKEAIEGRVDFAPFFVEVLQCLALFEERKLTPKPLGEKVVDFREVLTGLNRKQPYRYYKLAENVTDQDDLASSVLRMEMMTSTLAIRNWAYEPQMQKIAYDLADNIRDKFKKEVGYDPFIFLDIIFGLIEMTNEKLNTHLDRVRQIYHAKSIKEALELDEQNFPDTDKHAAASKKEFISLCKNDLKQLKEGLVFYSDVFLADIFSFSISEFKGLTELEVNEGLLIKIFDNLSMKFGELKDMDKDHVFLDNPIHRKPFIKLDDGRYYSAITYMFSHLGIDLLEGQINPYPKLRDNYLIAKGKYLEGAVTEVFTLAFPQAEIYPGSLWKDPVSQKGYENDLTITIADFAVIVEAKSGALTPQAKRGAPKRLFETLKELIVEPSEQAIRFENYLKDSPIIHEFKTKKGTVNKIDASKIKYYIPLGITLSSLVSIGSNLKKLIDAKVISHSIEELAPSISLSDLEVIFEMLPLQAEKIHYLSRRREFEAHVIFQGDELDLFGFYLDNGFNIGEAEYNHEYIMDFTLKSKELDPYMIGTSRGVNVKKPYLQKTKFWTDLLTKLENSGTQWLQSSYILLNTTKEDQANFEKQFEKLKEMIRKKKTTKDHNWVTFFSGPPRRRYAIIGYPYTGLTKEKRNDVMYEIMSHERHQGLRGIVIIGQDLDHPNYPYTLMAGSLDTDFFDSLETDVEE